MHCLSPDFLQRKGFDSGNLVSVGQEVGQFGGGHRALVGSVVTRTRLLIPNLLPTLTASLLSGSSHSPVTQKLSLPSLLVAHNQSRRSCRLLNTVKPLLSVCVVLCVCGLCSCSDRCCSFWLLIPNDEIPLFCLSYLRRQFP